MTIQSDKRFIRIRALKRTEFLETLRHDATTTTPILFSVEHFENKIIRQSRTLENEIGPECSISATATSASESQFQQSRNSALTHPLLLP